MRKAIPNALCDGIGSCVVQPRRVNPLEVKKKGEGFTPPMSCNRWLYFYKLSITCLEDCLGLSEQAVNGLLYAGFARSDRGSKVAQSLLV